MKLSGEIQEYLNGHLFSNSLEIKIAQKEDNIINRIVFLEKLITNKRVIHLGCCDHIPLINDKIRKNQWLHERIVNSAKICMGIDINAKAIEHIKQLGYTNVYSGNILIDNFEKIANSKWDYIILAEILEHISDPFSFLASIHKQYKNNIDRIVITVPNAFSKSNFNNVKKNKEIINSDHRYWFTPYTLSKIGMNAGFQIESFHFTHEISPRIGRRAKILVIPYLRRKVHYYNLKKYPGLRNTLIMTMKF